jgi:hypothetical protein
VLPVPRRCPRLALLDQRHLIQDIATELSVDCDNPLELARTRFVQVEARRQRREEPAVEPRQKCICLFCGKSHVVNSSKRMLHIAADCVDEHPQLKDMVSKAIGMKSLTNLVGKDKVDKVKKLDAS